MAQRDAAPQTEPDGGGVDVSDAPEHKPHVLRVEPGTVTGRRFEKRAVDAPGVPVPPGAVRRGDAPGRPTPIPHFPPAWEQERPAQST